jgi:hypothetical protein
VPSTYYATLQPDTTVNGKGTWIYQNPPPPQDPLQTGFVKLTTQGLLTIQLTGAKPTTGYYGVQCPIYRGSSCYSIQQSNGNMIFTTNQSGNITYTSPLGTNIPEDIFYVDNNNTYFGFIAGFSIP